MKFAVAALASTLLVATLSPVAAQDVANAPRRPTRSVTGEGRATAAPDMAHFSTGVVSDGKTAREALDANNKSVADMIASLKEAGLEPRDISTSGFSVQPQYAPPKKDGSEPPRLVGYQVQNTVSVRLRDLSRLGDLLDRMVTTGANQIGGIAFDVADTSRLEDQARVAAVQDARHQAELIAQASNVRLVRVLSVSADGGFRPMPRAMAPQMMMKAAADSVPVEAGETELRANVSVTYEIEPR